MKSLYIFIFLFLSGSLMSQEVLLEPGEIIFDLDGTTATKIGYKVINNQDVDLEWYWNIELAAGWPKEWEIQICDNISCWEEGTLQIPSDFGNMLNSGSETDPVFTYILVDPKGVEGKSNLKFCIYDNKSFTNPVVCSDFSTATTNVSARDYKIFPNPAQDYFQVSADENITQIEIYDIVGKNVLTVAHTPNTSYNIADLRKGLYVVRLIGTNGKQVKTMRLSKR